MSLLRNLERRLESLFEGIFTKGFKSSVQPIELAKKLAREMDAGKTISVAKVYAPNEYTLYVSEKDKENLAPFEVALIQELENFLIAHAKEKKYTLLNRPQVEIVSREDLLLGKIAVEGRLLAKETSTAEGTRIIEAVEEEWFVPSEASLIIKGERGESIFPLTKEVTSIGRSESNDIVLPDFKVSRRHALIVQMGSDFIVRDMGSTNGTFVNGKRVEEKSLKNGDTVGLGTTNLEFRRDRCST
ncbi:MAG: DUF3662 and FHA domain-containing protein [Actinomycetota bacterium]|nr:DUF3662 and FHA domain-containing protein [Actinomycetota bacterium]